MVGAGRVYGEGRSEKSSGSAGGQGGKDASSPAVSLTHPRVPSPAHASMHAAHEGTASCSGQMEWAPPLEMRAAGGAVPP